ncbi:hypothetical protein D0469_07595 [Peribacillus saganii]|uniref:Uncharacterized protein n=1 Tax=Peribacillus saganii TaxID=2303992 RepID=A0A372LRI8_9BACI|nr:hypothetical protein [Peribacillus saganii]RFU70440.1 hypothetical protein D0469_07595 [Peribacillus saganii]
MLSKIKGTKYMPEYAHPRYKVKLETPEGKDLIILFDYTESSLMKGFMPLKVKYDGQNKGAQLAWYTQEVEKMTVIEFLGILAEKLNKKYDVDVKS